MNDLSSRVKLEGRLVRLARLDGEKYKFLDDPPKFIHDLKLARTKADLFTFIEPLTGTPRTYDFHMEVDNYAALPITTFDHWWMHHIGFKARNKAKQAEKKGVVIREVPFDATLARGIWQIYNECPVRQGKPFPHYGKDPQTVFDEAATFLDSSVFIGAYFNGALIGFVKLTYDDARTQAGLMHIVSMVQHRDKAPTNGLIAQAVRSCADRGFTYLVYSNFAYGNKQRDSLSDFKERNGFQKIDVPRYYVPLTTLGRYALRLRLHHGILDRVPEPLIASLRAARNAYYRHKYHTVFEGQ
jgi:hypothetical protein